ncbi:hypothetical protein HHI36_010502, partial [Cryptolaemus montrouzieri]
MTVCSDDKSGLEIGSGQTIKHSASFKYLGVTLATNGKSSKDVSKKIAQGKRMIRQLNSMLWNKKLKGELNISSTSQYLKLSQPMGQKRGSPHKEKKDRLKALEMDLWRRIRLAQ